MCCCVRKSRKLPLPSALKICLAWPHGQSVCMKSTNKDLVNNERYRMGDEMFHT